MDTLFDCFRTTVTDSPEFVAIAKKLLKVPLFEKPIFTPNTALHSIPPLWLEVEIKTWTAYIRPHMSYECALNANYTSSPVKFAWTVMEA